MQSAEDAGISVLWLGPLLSQELGEQTHDKACCEKSRDTVWPAPLGPFSVLEYGVMVEGSELPRKAL